MTHSVHFLIVYNKLSKTCCITWRNAGVIPYASAGAKMHPDGERGPGDGGPKGPCHGTIGTVVNPPLSTNSTRCKNY